MKMNLSLLALQIALFHYPPADAFVQNNAVARIRKAHHSKQRRSGQKQVQVSSGSSVLDSSMGSSASQIIEILPVTHHRHPLFAKTNAVSKSMPVPHPELWRCCLPVEKKMKPQHEKEEGGFWGFLSPQPTQHDVQVPLRDIHVQFDNPAMGARQLLEHCGILSSQSSQSNNDPSSYTLPLPETIMAQTETLQHLTDILTYFQSVAGGGGPSCNKQPECIARVVSTIGSVGTKCPRWHADHVPVRLVMSIVGPGCEYIPETIATATSDDDENDQSNMPKVVVNRQALNNLDEEDTRKANDIIVPPESLSDAERKNEETIIKHAKAGDTVLLMGRGWEETTPSINSTNNSIESIAASSPSTNKVLAAVHRSPILEPNQERILLTVDLVDW